MTEPVDYCEYLKGRSRIGWLYRRYWLYPLLCRHLDGRVLDVGCGIGDFLRFRPDTVGVDVNPATVAWCRGLGLDARIMIPDELPFADAAFRGVVLDNVLEHLESPRALLVDIRRVLQPGGRFLIGVPGKRGFASDPDHKLAYSAESLQSAIEALGFRKCRLFYTPLRSDWLDRRMRQYCLYGVFERV
ncbi:MAG: class I SAM-dependent methyltransferase [Azonexus sp.]|nr:class I SAM-dependent methyltransferase [Betaproteobacteria bacterium]MBP6035444.1 class I SAM-dependent methyltransferase [Azonexus sp.]MBP6906432.1 class I SAM-dependent methyltransferase [Azonexus sp.]